MVCVVVMLFLLLACGADDIKHSKTDHWDVSLQRSTGSYGIVYIGDETKISDFKYDVSGTNISQQGSALSEHTTPFNMSGTVTDSEKNSDPIQFVISWNNQIESVTFQ